ncbi:PepSY domain-containing protein [Roseibium sp. RKSG952]|uniref:PepSY-associated TM helix domain-containing protein n=1 Tax=Roseibium sp. RKSG952 TaxID=2529384 RepID=UPI0012BCB1E4|nr:PepSY domain-containing protein [Roseibium sp. RKSG952]MTI00028.1 PepSY domain-containing protein [Roseibium sp. RKSG952]
MTDTRLDLPGSAHAPSRLSAFDKRFYIAAWRWHFYAGLYVAPFLIMLAVTGLMMMFIAVFDGRDGEKITVVPGTETLSLASQGASALEAVPDGKIVEWIGAPGPDRASVFRIAAGGGHQMVAVNPYSGDVLETWNRRDGWYDFAADIHGTLLIGDTGDRLIEIAAGFAIVLIVTGLYLWWPREGSPVRDAFVPKLAARGRAFWKSLHLTIGMYCSLILLVFLLSGLAWAGIWGGKFVQAWSTFPAEKWDNVPLSDDTHASMNHGAIKDVPWGLEQTPMPVSGSTAGVTGLGDGVPATADTVAALGRTLGFEGRYRVQYPGGADGVWTLSQDSMSNDSEDPASDRTVHIDQYTGRILADVGFEDYSLPAKGMAVGIAFHEGDMGLWNLVLNTVFCLSIVFLSISGLVMWWIRRPKGAGLRLVAPKHPDHLPHWRGAMLVMLFLALAFPLVGLTLIAVLALDILFLSRIPFVKRAIG